MSESQTTERVPTIEEALKEQRDFYFQCGIDLLEIGEIRFAKNKPVFKEHEKPIDSFTVTAVGDLVSFNVSRITKARISGYTFIAGQKINLSLRVPRMKFLKYSDDKTIINKWFGNEKI